MLTLHCSAASGMVAPPSIAPTTRLRRSSEYGFAIHAGLLPARSLNHIRDAMGIPRFSHFGKRSSLGERVGIPWLGYTCGLCAYCVAGRENLCDHPLFTG